MCSPEFRHFDWHCTSRRSTSNVKLASSVQTRADVVEARSCDGLHGMSVHAPSFEALCQEAVKSCECTVTRRPRSAPCSAACRQSSADPMITRTDSRLARLKENKVEQPKPVVNAGPGAGASSAGDNLASGPRSSTPPDKLPPPPSPSPSPTARTRDDRGIGVGEGVQGMSAVSQLKAADRRPSGGVQSRNASDVKGAGKGEGKHLLLAYARRTSARCRACSHATCP